MFDRRQLILALAAMPAALWKPSNAFAAKPLLRVSGSIGSESGSDPVEYDAAGLNGLPQTSFTTSTPWSTSPIEYKGISAGDLFHAVGAHGSRVQLVALNDYVVDSEIEFILAGDGLFATHQNGTPMPISEQGPVFLIFPFDARPELKHQSYYSRSVWQLAEIIVLP